MYKLRNSVLVLSILFIILYSMIGDKKGSYWTFLYYFNMYIIIYNLSSTYPNRRIRNYFQVYAVLMIAYSFSYDILKLDLNNLYTLIICLLSLVAVLILEKK